jgi:cell division protein FtsB
MIKTIDVSDLTLEQIEELQAIIAAFKTKNQIETQELSHLNHEEDMIDFLTKNPLPVDGFLSREEIYNRQG